MKLIKFKDLLLKFSNFLSAHVVLNALGSSTLQKSVFVGYGLSGVFKCSKQPIKHLNFIPIVQLGVTKWKTICLSIITGQNFDTIKLPEFTDGLCHNSSNFSISPFVFPETKFDDFTVAWSFLQFLFEMINIIENIIKNLLWKK